MEGNIFVNVAIKHCKETGGEMMKEFEERSSELQADMVAICLEYVEEKADKIY